MKNRHISFLFNLLIANFVLFICFSFIDNKEGSQIRLLEDTQETSTNTTNTTDNSTAPEVDDSTPHAELIEGVVSQFVCNNTDDCSNNGLCNLKTHSCECDEGFATYISNYTNYTNFTVIQELRLCNYEEKDQLTAFMLSLFVGFGSEHFYMDRNDKGIAKLFYYCFCCVGNIVLFVIYCWYPDKRSYIDFLGQYESIYMSCGFLVSILWVIYDLICIANLSHLDGNNIPLKPW